MLSLVFSHILCFSCYRWNKLHVMEEPFVLPVIGCCSIFGEQMLETVCYYYDNITIIEERKH